MGARFGQIWPHWLWWASLLPTLSSHSFVCSNTLFSQWIFLFLYVYLWLSFYDFLFSTLSFSRSSTFSFVCICSFFSICLCHFATSVPPALGNCFKLVPALSKRIIIWKLLTCKNDRQITSGVFQQKLIKKLENHPFHSSHFCLFLPFWSHDW